MTQLHTAVSASNQHDHDELLQQAIASAKSRKVECRHLVTEVALLFDELHRRVLLKTGHTHAP